MEGNLKMCSKNSNCTLKDFNASGEATIRFRMSQTNIHNLMFNFIMVGSSQANWVGIIKAKGNMVADHVYREVGSGGTILITDKISGGTHELDLEKLMQGIRMYLENDVILCPSLGNICMNADAADMIVQYALFEEVRYV